MGGVEKMSLRAFMLDPVSGYYLDCWVGASGDVESGGGVTLVVENKSWRVVVCGSMSVFGGESNGVDGGAML